MSLLKVLREEWLHSALEERLLPFRHHFLDLLDVVLHLLDQVINFLHNDHALGDEVINTLGIPSEVVNTRLERLVDLLNAVSEKGLFDWEKGCEDLIIHVDNQVKVASLATVNVDLLVKPGGTLWYLNVK